MAKKPTYDQQFCKKHNQRYADYLRECPICAGERIGKEYRKEVAKINKRLAKLR